MSARVLLATLAFCSWVALAPVGVAQQAAQVMDAPVLVVPHNQQRINRLADLNNDGWTDAVGSFWVAENKVAVFTFLNDGAGRLTHEWTHEWTQYGDDDMPFPIEVADLNGDGLDDFVSGVRDEIQVFLSHPSGPPTMIHDIYLGSGREAQDLALGDYDGDGNIDAAVRMKTITTGADTGVRIYHQLLAPTPTSNWTILPPAGAGQILENADADGDGVTDLMVVGNTRVDFFNVRLGQLQWLNSYSHGLGAGVGVSGASGDIDGDTDMDVVVFGMNGQFTVLRRVGSNAFIVEPPKAGGPATDLADVDGDGDLDGVCCGGGGGYSSFTNNGKSFFEIAIADGNGGFEESFRLPSMGANEIAGVDDIDQDGDLDLIAGRIVYYNVRGIHPTMLTEVPSISYWLEAHDVDGDGDPDAGIGFDQYARNRGDGEFEMVSRNYPTPPSGSTFDGPGFLGDFDGDGDVDVIVHERIGGVLTNERLLRNNGGGGLLDGASVTAPGVLFHETADVSRILIGDVNGDGRPDVISLKTDGTDETRVFTQDPNGQFTQSALLFGKLGKTLVDLDGDGFDDLVVTTADDVLIHFGDANGAMTTETSLLNQTSGAYVILDPPVSAADLDGDGDDDLIVPFHLPNEGWFIMSPWVLENIGGRQFTAHANLFPEYVGAMLPVYAEDMNGDGAVDVMMGQRKDASLDQTVFAMSVFLGSNSPGIDFSYAGEQWPLLWNMADLDGDGDLDGMSSSFAYRNHTVVSPDESYRRQYGVATPGAGGQAPTFGAVGPFQSGESIELRITGAAPNAPGVLFVGVGDGAAKIGANGGYLVTLPVFVALNVVFPSVTGEPGSGQLTLPVIVPPATVGNSFYHQVLTIDPQAQGGAAVSNGLRLYYGM